VPEIKVIINRDVEGMFDIIRAGKELSLSKLRLEV